MSVNIDFDNLNNSYLNDAIISIYLFHLIKFTKKIIYNK